MDNLKKYISRLCDTKLHIFASVILLTISSITLFSQNMPDYYTGKERAYISDSLYYIVTTTPKYITLHLNTNTLSEIKSRIVDDGTIVNWHEYDEETGGDTHGIISINPLWRNDDLKYQFAKEVFNSNTLAELGGSNATLHMRTVVNIQEQKIEELVFYFDLYFNASKENNKLLFQISPNELYAFETKIKEHMIFVPQGIVHLLDYFNGMVLLVNFARFK